MNSGNFELTPETKTALLEACADIYEERSTLQNKLDTLIMI